MSSKTIAAAIAVIVILLIAYMFWPSSAAPAPTPAPASPGKSGSSSGAAGLPAGISEGDVIRCADDGMIVKVVGGQRRWYPNPTIYAKYGSPAARNVDCATLRSLPQGPNFERFCSWCPQNR
jgi:hypothetical protein